MDIKNKKQIYKKVQNSALNLLIWNNDLPESIGSLKVKLTKEELEKLKNIVWFIQNKKLWRTK
tara:strand:+ start:372 stop:560 length:189 start_codon:yes stop_codon:yes gene_type:complete